VSRWPWIVALLLGCPTTDGGFSAPDDDDSTSDDDDAGDDDDGTPSGGSLLIGPEVPVAADAIAGFDRLDEDAAGRGLIVDLLFPPDPQPCPEILGGVVVSDLDQDGDLDLLLHRYQGFPLLWENQGGAFTRRDIPHSTADRFGKNAMGFSAVDLNGDDLPDVVISAANLLVVSWNEGGLVFSDFEVLWNDPTYPQNCMNTQIWGDYDGDGDLDVALPGTFKLLGEGTVFDYWAGTKPPGGIEALNNRPLVLEQQPGGFVEASRLTFSAAQEGTVAIAGAFTDIDDDRDLDLIVTSHSPTPPLPPGSVFRNDDGAFTNAGPELGVQFVANGMGADVADLNEDGRQDFCFSDATHNLMCLMSDEGSGLWVEGSLAAGLTVDITQAPGYDAGDDVWNNYSGWSVEFNDLDLDGELDVALAAGGAPGETVHLDALWRGLGGGQFEEHSVTSGFADFDNHFGLAAGDFDADGTRDLVVAGWTGQPLFWSNPPSPGAWVAVDFDGPPGNTQGFGAKVTLEVGGRTLVRELHALRGLAQSEPSVHFGLGSANTIDRITALFPDGSEVQATDVPVNRRLTVVHPSR
jgi:enediyne biosynthesis protein E4